MVIGIIQPNEGTDYPFSRMTVRFNNATIFHELMTLTGHFASRHKRGFGSV